MTLTDSDCITREEMRLRIAELELERDDLDSRIVFLESEMTNAPETRDEY